MRSYRARCYATRWVAALVLMQLSSARAWADDDPLTIADLQAYRQALKASPDSAAISVSYRELWAHPEKFRGRKVHVEATVKRVFRQGSFGAFPPLAEMWAVDSAGNPYCLVFPSAPGDRNPTLNTPVRFTGTFLKRVTYQGGDGDRLAPLIVGDRPPSSAPANTSRNSGGGITVTDWTVGLSVAAFVVMILAVQHFRRPIRRTLSLESDRRPPEFIHEPKDAKGLAVRDDEV